MGTYLSKDLKEIKMLVILQFMETHSNRGREIVKRLFKGVFVVCSRNNEEVSASSVMGSVGGD